MKQFIVQTTEIFLGVVSGVELGKVTVKMPFSIFATIWSSWANDQNWIYHEQ